MWGTNPISNRCKPHIQFTLQLHLIMHILYNNKALWSFCWKVFKPNFSPIYKVHTHTNRMSCELIKNYIKTRGLLPEKASRHIPYIIRKHSFNGLIITAQHESQNKLMGDWCKPITCVMSLAHREPHFLLLTHYCQPNRRCTETSPPLVWCGTTLWARAGKISTVRTLQLFWSISQAGRSEDTE